MTVDAIALDDGDHGDVFLRARAYDAVLHFQFDISSLSHEGTYAVDGLDKSGALFDIHMGGKIIRSEERMLHGIGEGGLARRDLVIETVLSIFGDELAFADNGLDLEGAWLVDEEDVSVFPRRDRTDVVIDLIGFRRIDGAHLDGSHRCDAGLDSQTDDVVDVTVCKDAACVNVIGAEAGVTRHARAAFRDGTDIFIQEFRHGRFTDDGMDAFSGFFQKFFMIVAFVIDTDTAHEIFIEVFTASERAAAKDRTVTLLGLDDGIQRILILGHDGFTDELPDAVAAGVLMISLMVFRCDIVRDGGLRDGVGRLVRKCPENLQWGRIDFFKNILEPIDTNDGNIFIKSADDARGAMRHDGFCKAGHAHLAAFDMDVAVDEPRSEILSLRIDDLRMFIDVVGNVLLYRGDLAFVNGNVRLIVFTGIDIDQGTAHDRHVRFDAASAGVNVGSEQFSSQHMILLCKKIDRSYKYSGFSGFTKVRIRSLSAFP